MRCTKTPRACGRKSCNHASLEGVVHACHLCEAKEECNARCEKMLKCMRLLCKTPVLCPVTSFMQSEHACDACRSASGSTIVNPHGGRPCLQCVRVHCHAQARFPLLFLKIGLPCWLQRTAVLRRCVLGLISMGGGAGSCVLPRLCVLSWASLLPVLCVRCGAALPGLGFAALLPGVAVRLRCAPVIEIIIVAFATGASARRCSFALPCGVIIGLVRPPGARCRPVLLPRIGPIGRCRCRCRAMRCRLALRCSMAVLSRRLDDKDPRQMTNAQLDHLSAIVYLVPVMRNSADPAAVSHQTPNPPNCSSVAELTKPHGLPAAIPHVTDGGCQLRFSPRLSADSGADTAARSDSAGGRLAAGTYEATWACSSARGSPSVHGTGGATEPSERVESKPPSGSSTHQPAVS